MQVEPVYKTGSTVYTYVCSLNVFMYGGGGGGGYMCIAYNIQK